jgi:threonine/homoserine/homoserine lactone efflux protein
LIQRTSRVFETASQSLILGFTQISISFLVNLAIVLSAATLSGWFGCNPRWLSVQRYVMGFVLSGLALRLAAKQRNA